MRLRSLPSDIRLIVYEPRWANVEADPTFCHGTCTRASVCNGGDGSDPYPLYQQGSRRLRPWEEDTTVTGARTNNSTVWLPGVLASMPAYTVSEDGMAPQNRIDVAMVLNGPGTLSVPSHVAAAMS